jgi:hypothetical protein
MSKWTNLFNKMNDRMNVSRAAYEEYLPGSPFSPCPGALLPRFPFSPLGPLTPGKPGLPWKPTSPEIANTRLGK